MYPEHVATMQIAANRNWEDMGMNLRAELREFEDPERHDDLKEAGVDPAAGHGRIGWQRWCRVVGGTAAMMLPSSN